MPLQQVVVEDKIDGNDSVFATITSVHGDGGGGGGHENTSNMSSVGSSGGGKGLTVSGNYTGGSGTSGQGHNGGSSYGSSPYDGGGGGGVEQLVLTVTQTVLYLSVVKEFFLT